VATQFTGFEGKYVKLEETISSFEEILDGKLDEIPEQYFMYKGGVDEVRAAYEKDQES
jgi:F-type H+-transporting ATPase subunit beta